MLRTTYYANDFDYAIACIDELGLFYAIPVAVFVAYGSEIHLVESEKRQRLPKSAAYREAWQLLSLEKTSQRHATALD